MNDSGFESTDARVVCGMTAVLLLLFLSGGCAFEVGTDGQAMTRSCIVTEGLCGSCDPRCHVVMDTPTSERDVITEGTEPNGEGVMYDGEAGGVVLGIGTSTGPDTDGDGLCDASDPFPDDIDGDDDGDGYPDAYESYLGTDPLVADPPPSEDDFYVVLPLDGGSVVREIPPDIPLTVRTADVYFLIDVTGSMGGEIDNLQATLTSYVIPEIAEVIDDVQFGVGRHGDFPEDRYSWRDEPYVNLVSITDDIEAVQDAINGLVASGGADGPESQTAALHAIATGEGLDTDCNGIEPASCPRGMIGYPCFRPGAQPIIILVTDNSFHNGVYDSIYPRSTPSCYTYGSCRTRHCTPLSPAVPPLETVVEELNDIGARVITVFSGYYPSSQFGHVSTWSSSYRTPTRWPSGLGDLIDSYYLSLGTNTVDSEGYPFVYKVTTTGTGLGSEVVNAVSDLVDLMLLQVNSRWSDTDPTEPDASALIQDVDPVWCSHCGSLNHETNTAFDVYPGSNVTFQVTLENTILPPGPEPTEYILRIAVLSDDTAVLTQRLIHVLVPASTAASGPIETGRYWRTWDARTLCTVDQVPQWSQLYFDTTTPDGTDVTFRAQTSNTVEGLESAPPVTLGRSPDDTSPIAIYDALSDADVENHQRYFRLEATLHTDTPGTSPVLHRTRTVLYCVDDD